MGAIRPRPPALPQKFVRSSSVFSFVLRKTDEAELGMVLYRSDCGQALHVGEVLPDGAIDTWNRQCSEGTDKVILPGDLIVRVNYKDNASEMLDECRKRQVLSFTVVQGPGWHQR